MTALTTHSKHKALRLFIRFILLHKQMYGVVLVLFFIAGLTINLVPYATGLFTTTVTQTPINPERIWYVAVFFIACKLIHWFFWHFAEYIYSRFILRDLFHSRRGVEWLTTRIEITQALVLAHKSRLFSYS